MPELPEVETARRGIAPYVVGRTVARVQVHERRLRRPVPGTLERELPGHAIRAVERRAKFLLLHTDAGTVILHLGMSGSLRILPHDAPPGPHDRLDLVFTNGGALRLRDPRRFGMVLWTRRDPLKHPLLARLGPEPLDPGFDGDALHRRGRGRRVAIKQFLMDGRNVAGLGNIYATEALFTAGIHPARAAGRISRKRYRRLAHAVRQVLTEAVAAGGTTLRDFVNGAGEPGYFQLRLRVYGKEGAPCPACGHAIRRTRQGQRSTYYCPRCQH